MNETNNNTRGPGRPRTIKRTIYLHPDTHVPRAKGRVAHGSKWLKVEIDRAVNAKDFIYGTTKVYSESEVTLGKPQVDLNVVVISPEVQAEAGNANPEVAQEVVA